MSTNTSREKVMPWFHPPPHVIQCWYKITRGQSTSMLHSYGQGGHSTWNQSRADLVSFSCMLWSPSEQYHTTTQCVPVTETAVMLPDDTRMIMIQLHIKDLLDRSSCINLSTSMPRVSYDPLQTTYKKLTGIRYFTWWDVSRDQPIPAFRFYEKKWSILCFVLIMWDTDLYSYVELVDEDSLWIVPPPWSCFFSWIFFTSV